MHIYKDKFSGDELFSDTYPMETIKDVVYKVKGKMRTDTIDISDAAIGGNKSAEGGDEGTEAATVSGVDVILNGRLVEFPMKKKEYMKHLKEYMKAVKSKMEEEESKEVELFQKNIQDWVKEEVIGDFGECQFYCGESMHPEGMLVVTKWDGETPYFFFFKHGLDEEKV